MALVGIREAAKQLGIAASTVSRYVAANPDLNRAGPGKPPQVDVDELRAHRSGNVDWAKAGNYAGLPFGQADRGSDGLGDAADEGDEEEAGRAIPARATGRPAATAPAGLARARTAQATIKARRELNALESDLKITVAKRKVEEGAAETGLMLKQLLATRNRDLSLKAAGMTDPAAIMALLDEADARLLETLSSALERKLRHTGDTDDGA